MTVTQVQYVLVASSFLIVQKKIMSMFLCLRSDLLKWSRPCSFLLLFGCYTSCCSAYIISSVALGNSCIVLLCLHHFFCCFDYVMSSLAAACIISFVAPADIISSVALPT